MRCREVKWLALDHTAGRWQSEFRVWRAGPEPTLWRDASAGRRGWGSHRLHLHVPGPMLGAVCQMALWIRFLYHISYLVDFCFIPWSGPCLWILLVKKHWMSTRWAFPYIYQTAAWNKGHSSFCKYAGKFLLLFSICLALGWILVVDTHLRDPGTFLGISSHNISL